MVFTVFMGHPVSLIHEIIDYLLNNNNKTKIMENNNYNISLIMDNIITKL